MSQKYPEGAIIVREHLKWKVIGCAGDARFIQGDDPDIDVWSTSVQMLERVGWTVEETPWVPKEGEEVWMLRECDLEPMPLKYYEPVFPDYSFKAQGRIYPTEELAQAAAIRVKAAYKGEK